MQLPIYQVDAFTGRVFCGNPAAVVPLESWLPVETMQSVALENNLSETAFIVREGGGYRIRWFTPAVEVALCGHATLASAHVIFEKLGHASDDVNFESQSSGPLRVFREDGRLVLDFPSRPGDACNAPAQLVEALGATPIEVREAPYWLCVLESEAEVAALAPDMRGLANFEPVIATAAGTDVDFVSRMFAPNHGIDEDPVTGSAHCTLTPYWSKRLGKKTLTARQISARVGDLICEAHGERIHVAGHTVLYLEGTISI